MPLPSSFLFPAPYLVSEGPGPFADLILEAVSPWADIDGFWNNYNAALSTMFEPVYDIVADQGDGAQTVIAVVSSPLDTTVSLTEIPVQSVSDLITQDTEITLSFAQSTQVFKLTFDATPGETTIFVEEATPNYPYPQGTTVQLAFLPGWSALLSPIDCPDQFLPFLAQFNGTDIPVGLDAPTARSKIIGESALQRGTLAAVRSAVTRNLSGTQAVSIEERVDSIGNANSYWFVVVVRPEEVISVQAITDAVNAVKPGGVQWTLVQTDSWVITQVEFFQPTVTGLEGQFVTIAGLEQDRIGS